MNFFWSNYNPASFNVETHCDFWLRLHNMNFEISKARIRLYMTLQLFVSSWTCYIIGNLKGLLYRIRDYLGTIQRSRAGAWDSKFQNIDQMVPSPIPTSLFSLLRSFVIVLRAADPYNAFGGGCFEKTCYKSRGFGLGSPYLEGLLLLQVAKYQYNYIVFCITCPIIAI